MRGIVQIFMAILCIANLSCKTRSAESALREEPQSQLKMEQGNTVPTSSESCYMWYGFASSSPQMVSKVAKVCADSLICINNGTAGIGGSYMNCAEGREWLSLDNGMPAMDCLADGVGTHISGVSADCLHKWKPELFEAPKAVESPVQQVSSSKAVLTTNSTQKVLRALYMGSWPGEEGAGFGGQASSTQMTDKEKCFSYYGFGTNTSSLEKLATRCPASLICWNAGHNYSWNGDVVAEMQCSVGLPFKSKLEKCPGIGVGNHEDRVSDECKIVMSRMRN